MPPRKGADKRKTKPAKRKASAKVTVDVSDDLKAAILTLKQERFCQAYIENEGNASEAYRCAYDAEKMKSETINRNAHELLNNSKIAARVEHLKADALARHQVTVDRVIAEYSKLAFSNMQHYMSVTGEGLAVVDFSNLTEDQAAAIQEIKVDRLRGVKTDGEEGDGYVERVTFKLADKRGALDSLSKFLGVFVDKHELTGKDGGPIVVKEGGVSGLLAAAREAREARLKKSHA